MRLLIVISSLGTGGAERATLQLAKEWTLRGHQVVILTLAADETREYLAVRDVPIVALDLVRASPGPIGGLLSNLRRIAAIRRQIRRFAPDVVIGMMDSVAILVGLACLGIGCARIGCERTAPALAPLTRGWSFLRWASYGLLDLVTVQTAPAADWLLRHTTARRVHVIPNAVTWPLPRHEPCLDPGAICGHDRQILLAVGRLTAQKRFNFLIEVFTRIAGDHPDWDLVVLGEGEERHGLEHLVGRRGMAARIHLPGRVGNLSDWYARAAVFALTSAFEGFPNVLLEAMAHGLAPVSVDCPHGPSDIVRSGIDGLLVDVDDRSAFARGLAKLMDDTSLRRRIAQAAPDVRGRFSVDRMMNSWDTAFSMALAGRRSSRASAGR